MKVKVPPVSPVPSAALGESIDSVGASSSSVMVPVPVPVPSGMTACVGLLNVTSTVSSASSTASPVTVTAIVRLVVPGVKVNVPAAIAV